MFRQSLNLQGLIFHFCISKINYSIEFKIHFKTKTELTEERPLREGILRFLTRVVFHGSYGELRLVDTGRLKHSSGAFVGTVELLNS